MIGSTLNDRYRLEAEVGRGHTNVTYHASGTDLERGTRRDRA